MSQEDWQMVQEEWLKQLSKLEVTMVLTKFDHPRVGAKAIAQSQYRSQYPEAVPIS